MRAVVVEAFGAAPEVRDVPDPEVPADGVVVAVAATGLCRSDWHAWAGHDDSVSLPHVPGHELAGTVVAVGPDLRGGWAPGDRVTTPFVLACGDCAACRRGDAQVCARQEQPGFTLWGSWAELVALPRADANLVRLPDDVPDAAAAALGCRFGTAYRGLVEVAGLRAGETVAVHGCGGVGLSAVMIARALGARVLAVDPSAESRALAAALGAETAASAVELADLLADAGAGDGADVAVDAVGHPDVLDAGLRCLRPRGRHLQIGLLAGPHARPRVDVGLVVGRELQLLGSHGIAAASYPALLDLVADGALDVASLVTRTTDLDGAARLLPTLADPGVNAGGMTVARPRRDDLP